MNDLTLLQDPPVWDDVSLLERQRLAAQYQRDAIAEAQAQRPDDDTAEDLG